jgi:hypothetical protein
MIDGSRDSGVVNLILVSARDKLTMEVEKSAPAARAIASWKARMTISWSVAAGY